MATSPDSNVRFDRFRNTKSGVIPPYRNPDPRRLQRDRSFALNFDRIRKRDNIAYLQLRREDGSILFHTHRFLLQDVSEQRQEKFQVTDTFGFPHIFFYGKRPEIYQFNGVLPSQELSISSSVIYKSLDPASDGVPFNPDFVPDADWAANFIEIYEREFRGTRTAKRNTYVQIAYDDLVREGYILSMDLRYSQAAMGLAPFTFTMFITRAYHQRPSALTAVAALDRAFSDSTVGGQYAIDASDPAALETETMSDQTQGLSPNAQMDLYSASSDNRVMVQNENDPVPLIQAASNQRLEPNI